MTKYHPQEYDLTVKRIVAEVGITIVSELLGLEILEHEVLSLELITLEKRGLDQVFKIRTPEGEFVLNIEIQSTNDSDMARRMLEYLAKAHRQHVLPVISVVLYLGAGPMRMPREVAFETPWCSLKFRYTIITLNELSPDRFLNREEPNYFILAVLTKVDSPHDTLRAVLRKLQDSVPPQQLEDHVLKLDVLCQLRGMEDLLEKEVRNLPVKVELKRLVTYKLGKEEGLEEGMKKGMKKGLEEGMKKGIKEGIMVALEVRFGREEIARHGIDQAIEAIEDLSVLNQLKVLVRQASDLQEIQAFLDENKSRE